MKLFDRQDIDLMVVDDEKDILELSEIALNRYSDNLNIETTTNPDEVLESVDNNDVDAILSDYNMPAMTGVELLENVRRIDEDLPFILYTGEGSEEIAEESINADVTDYFSKEAGLDHYQFILNSVEKSVEKYRDMERAEILSILVENSNHPIVVTDIDSNILYVNKALEEVSGYSEKELIGENPNIMSSGEHSEEEFEKMYKALNNGEKYKINGMTNQTKKGELYVKDQEVFPISVHSDTPEYFVGISELRE